MSSEGMKRDARHMSKEQQREARRRAMILLRKQWHDREVALAVGVNQRTVRQWKQHQREHGTKSLLRDERGRAVGEGRTLNAAQEKAVRTLIAKQMPDQLQLPFALWTRKAVAQLLETRYGLKLPVRTMGEYLKRWGFTPQKPIQKAYEQNPKKVKRWLKEEYPAIATQAKAEGAEIYWGDQTGGEPALETLRVFRDECGDQPWQCAVDGLQRRAECRPPHPFHGAAGAPDERTQGVSDSG